MKSIVRAHSVLALAALSLMTTTTDKGPKMKSKFKLIIVEGPDGAGKTTLIKKLRIHFEGQGLVTDVHHHGAYIGIKGIAHHYLRSVEQACENGGNVVIMDRSWIAEPIYGEHMRGGSRLDSIDYRYLNVKAAMAPAVVVFCMPKFSTCLKAYMNRREIEYVDDPAKLEAIYNGYKNTFNAVFHIPKMHYDFEHDLEAKQLIARVTA